MFFVSNLSFAQVNESFSDGNFSENPAWSGTTSNFIVNNAFQLQSRAAGTSVSYLFTPSEAMDDAVWEISLKITYSTSASNYAAVYIVSDRQDLSAGCNGYYVQVGGTSDEISLFLQTGAKKTKIIDGADKRVDMNPVDIRIKVTRDAQGNFALYSKLASELNYVLEGTATNTDIRTCSHFGVLFSNTSTTGNDYYFDDILVTGNKGLDNEPPAWNVLRIVEPNRLHLGFSEPMDFRHAAFGLDQGMGIPSSQQVADDKTSVELVFSNDFQKGKLYTLEINGVTDLSGNLLNINRKSTGIAEPVALGDLVFNEVMFENPLNSLEYVEIYNGSEKVLDVSELVFTTRKADGLLNSGIKIPQQTLMLPNGYLALCANADSVRNYHRCPAESYVVTTATWPALNNSGSTLVLANAAKDTVYDEFSYDAKWHHVLVKNPKGVALERINPLLPVQSPDSWHSAASEVNYGTPGYKNSQYRDLETENAVGKTVWLDPEAFSPDNDGVNDVCFIHYRTDSPGYMANALVLNSMGVKLRTLASNLLLSSEGHLAWDGKTDKGGNTNVGIYVLYFEIFNPVKGHRKQLKLPIVITSR